VARVEWSRLSGDETEAVLAVLLCREHPAAVRVKPSQGDGGIDVWVPDGERASVYQIKGYTGNIDSTRQGHITKSWNTLIAYTQAKSIKLSSWYLVTPENPTKEQLEWFKGLVNGADFPCRWLGLDFVDGLAAKFPEVVDYYLRDGKDRLETTIQRFLSIAGLSNPASSPSESTEHLRELHQSLNEFDPHFYYDFAVQSRSLDGNCPSPPSVPGTIAIVQMADADRCVTYNIVPRFNEALKERPVPGSMTLMAEPGSALQEEIEDWAKFGTPLNSVPAKNVNWDLPGGFGGSFDEALVTISDTKPLPGAVHEEITLRVLDADGTVAASLEFLTEAASSGIDQNGVRSLGHDKAAGLIRYEIRMRREENGGQIAARINITIEDPIGRQPADMLPGLRFAAALNPARNIQIFSRNGPALTPPLPLPQELMPESQARLWILICESLATIQEHVIERIRFPDILKDHADSPDDAVENWYQAAQLLRGEELGGSWQNVGLHLNPGQEPPTEVQRGRLFGNSYSTRIGEKVYDLGTVVMQVASVRVDPNRPPVDHDDHVDVHFVPADDDSMTLRMASGTALGGSSSAA
jgi:hypothetical protein